MLDVILSAGIQIFFNAPTDEVGRYRWTNKVLVDPKGMKDCKGKKQVTPYQDPPNCGFKDHVADTSPYYYDDEDCAECSSRYKHTYYKHRDGNKMIFTDFPNDHRLKRGQKIEFEACIVDTYLDDKELECVKWNWIRTEHPAGKTELVK